MLLKIDNAWISSPEHLERFAQTGGKNQLWRFFFRINKIPPGFPALNSGMGKFPVVYFAEGQLSLYEREFEFRARKPAAEGKYIVYNLDERLTFNGQYATMMPEKYIYPGSIMKAYNIEWIKLKVMSGNITRDVLVSCNGIAKTLQQVKAENSELFRILQGKAVEYGNKD